MSGPPRVVLASASPRRRELLAALVPDFEVAPSDIDENMAGAPVLDARDLARAKAEFVAQRRPDSVVIGSDTIVARGNQLYGKPTDDGDAIRMLEELAGREHYVITGIAVVRAEGTSVDHSVAAIQMRFMYPDEIEAYVASGSTMDKAGGYAIQDATFAPVEQLVGCYCNVMGLPLWRLKPLLERAGVPCAAPSAMYDRCATCPERL